METLSLTPGEEPIQERSALEIITALDNAPLNRRHWYFFIALLAAMIFDYSKPITISFVIPGMRAMFNLSSVSSSYLAVAGLSGTTVGAIFWGFMADRIGRKTTLLWTITLFSLASFCGLAVEYWQSLLACFVMGFGVGGEAPIAVALAAEYIPTKYRVRLLLLLNLSGWVGGYTLSAGLSALFNTFYPLDTAWRFVWLAGILPALMIVLLRHRTIPESARYLITHNRIIEARQAAGFMIGSIPPLAAATAEESHRLVRPPRQKFYGRTLALGFFSFAVGLANYGFITWLPTLLGNLGYSSAGSSGYLALSSLIALPALAITLFLLRKWETRNIIVVYALGAGAGLLITGFGMSTGLTSPWFLVLAISGTFFFITSVGSIFSFYLAEVFPTALRARRSGLVSALGRLGGVLGPYLGGVWLGQGSSMLGVQLPFATLIIVAGIVVALVGVNTKGRSLEEITGEAQVNYAP